jgi:hypothetical protein
MKRCFFISSYEISLNELCTSIKIKSPSWTILTSKNKHASSMVSGSSPVVAYMMVTGNLHGC